MKIGIFGTGGVGQTFATRLAAQGHEVRIGTRDVHATLANTAPDGYGNPPFSVWHKDHAAIPLGTFAEVAQASEILINATSGFGSIPALEAAGVDNLRGKILIDISNPLDFSKGMPPSLFVSNTDSLGEQIQAAFPDLKVVKTLNTLNAQLMVNPQSLADGDHHLFMAGNDAEAKATVCYYLQTWFGWKHILDLGDIRNARGVEMYLPLWLSLWGSLQSANFNLKVVQG